MSEVPLYALAQVPTVGPYALPVPGRVPVPPWYPNHRSRVSEGRGVQTESRFRAKRKQLKWLCGLETERQGQNLALTVLYMLQSCDSGEQMPTPRPWKLMTMRGTPEPLQGYHTDKKTRSPRTLP